MVPFGIEFSQSNVLSSVNSVPFTDVLFSASALADGSGCRRRGGWSSIRDAFPRALGAVIGYCVSGGWFFGQCPAAWWGAGPAKLSRRGGQASAARFVPAGRPRRVPPRRRWVKNHPPRPRRTGLCLAAHQVTGPAVAR